MGDTRNTMPKMKAKITYKWVVFILYRVIPDE